MYYGRPFQTNNEDLEEYYKELFKNAKYYVGHDPYKEIKTDKDESKVKVKTRLDEFKEKLQVNKKELEAEEIRYAQKKKYLIQVIENIKQAIKSEEGALETKNLKEKQNKLFSEIARLATKEDLDGIEQYFLLRRKLREQSKTK